VRSDLDALLLLLDQLGDQAAHEADLAPTLGISVDRAEKLLRQTMNLGWVIHTGTAVGVAGSPVAQVEPGWLLTAAGRRALSNEQGPRPD
jgi:hypothetical protein